VDRLCLVANALIVCVQTESVQMRNDLMLQNVDTTLHGNGLGLTISTPILIV
jgi:hypothetical protein